MNHFSRRVSGVKENHFMISRRCVCHGCKEDRQKKVQRVIEAAIDNDTDAEVKEPKKTQCTFMGWNPISAGLLPHGCGDKFPAFLTWRGAVDLDVIDLMRPLFDKGLRPEALSDVLLEMHSETHARHCT